MHSTLIPDLETILAPLIHTFQKAPKNLKVFAFSGWGYQHFWQSFFNHDAFKNHQDHILSDVAGFNHGDFFTNRYIILTHSYGLFRFLDALLNLKSSASKPTLELLCMLEQIEKIYIFNGFLDLKHHEIAIQSMLKNIINPFKNRWLATLQQFYHFCEKNTDSHYLTLHEYLNTKITHFYQQQDVVAQKKIENTLRHELQNMARLHEPQQQAIYVSLLERLAPISHYIHGEYDPIVGGAATNYTGLLHMNALHSVLPIGHFLPV